MAKLMVGALTLGMAAAAARADTTLDLTGEGNTGEINDALFEQGDTTESSGTGTFIAFLRIQKDGTEAGYNQDMKGAYDEKDSFTYNITLGDLPVVTINGVQYYEIWLDINENSGSSNEFLSIDQLKVRVSATLLEGNDTAPDFDDITGSTLVYDMDAAPDGNGTVKLDYSLEAGSGEPDMRFLLPVSLFSGISGINNDWGFYLFSDFGNLNSTGYDSSDGFEEWAVRVGEGTVIETIPLPTSAWMGLLGLGGLAFLQFRRRKQGQALDV
jgi:MYXO-CTERM domain-containing protein